MPTRTSSTSSSVTIPPLPLLPEVKTTPPPLGKPFSLDVDMVELSYGDFVMKKFIYKDLTWVEAKEACDSINGLLPYFNTITDLEGKLQLKTND